MLNLALLGIERVCRQALLLLVRAYRYWLKPWLGNSCRFEPSCSAFALQALQQHGAARGAALAGWRLLRCHPWCDGGDDAVPEPKTNARVKPNDLSTSRGLFTALVPTETASTRVDAAPARRKPT